MRKSFELVSDLHLDFYRDAEDILSSWEAKSDILVIAGDMCEMRHLNLRWLDILRAEWHNVVYVPGNHDYYGRNLDSGCLDRLRLHCHVLDRNQVQINGIMFAGCTLWFPHPMRNRKYEKLVNDFSQIGPYNGVPFWDDVSRLHAEDKEFLSWSQAHVWVTHYMPFAQSIHPRYAGAQSNIFFYSQCDDLLDASMSAPKVVVHGHTHEQVDYTVHAGPSITKGNFSMIKTPEREHPVRVICNPMGYPGENSHYGLYAPKLIEFDL